MVGGFFSKPRSPRIDARKSSGQIIPSPSRIHFCSAIPLPKARESPCRAVANNSERNVLYHFATRRLYDAPPTSGCRVLYVIHYLGWPQPILELRELCKERGIVLIEDCALSLLSQFNGRPLGTFGDYSVFCLYKTLPVPNGGMLIQNGTATIDSK